MDVGSNRVNTGRTGATGTMDHGIVGRLMDGVDPDLLAFLRTRVTSFAKWEVIRFFHENTHATDSAESIARHARRDEQMTRVALAELSAQGILVAHQQGEVTVYSLSDDPEVRDLVRRFGEASTDRRFRIKAMYHIVRSMR